MRIRNALAAVATAALLTGVLAAPASAGTGTSTFCSDGVGYREVPVSGLPLTVGVELSYAPGGNHQTIIICYGSSAPGTPNTVTGGEIFADVYTTTSTVYPGAYVALVCVPDIAAGFAPTCGGANSADFALNELAVATPPNSVCLVGSGTSCALYVPGVKLVDGDTNRALLQVMLLGTRYEVDVPQNCLAVLVACP